MAKEGQKHFDLPNPPGRQGPPSSLDLPNNFIEDDPEADDEADNQVDWDTTDLDEEDETDQDGYEKEPNRPQPREEKEEKVEKLKEKTDQPKPEAKPEPEPKPGSTREEIKKPEDPRLKPEVKVPKPNTTTATKEAEQLGKQAGGVVKEGAQAASEAVAAGAKTASQAIKVGAQAAGRAVMAAAQAIGAALAPYAGWIALIVAIIVIVFALARGLYSRFNRGTNGATASIAADVSIPEVRQAVTNLAALAGDDEARLNLTSEQLAQLPVLLTKLTAEITRLPDDQAAAYTEHISAASSLAMEVGAGSTSSNRGQALTQLFYHIDQISNLALGITATSATDISSRARTATGESNWVRTTNDTKVSEPLRDGRNVVNGKRGCDPVGFISYVLRGNEPKCQNCLTPNGETFARTFASALTTQPVNGKVDLESLQNGDIILSTKKVNNVATDGAFVFLREPNTELTTAKVAYCSATGPKIEETAPLVRSDVSYTIFRFRPNPQTTTATAPTTSSSLGL